MPAPVDGVAMRPGSGQNATAPFSSAACVRMILGEQCAERALTGVVYQDIMPRIFDLIAVAAVAVIVLMPSGSIEAKPALEGDKIELDRIAALEDARAAAPDDVERALALGDAYLHMMHADWALATTAQLAGSDDYRVALQRATAYAERVQPAAAVAAAERGLALCDGAPRAGQPRCDGAARVRLELVAGPMRALVEQHIDPRKDPRGAREAVAKVLRATKANELKPPAPPVPPAPKK
jgi:hypothetical protein